MTYKETIDYLFSRLPMFHRIGAAALKPGLDNIRELCEHLGDPQFDFPSIHIAGTNGKGSTAHFIASILQEAGYRVGLFSSPHLKDFRERIKINGEFISEEEIIEFVNSNKEAFEKIDASFFEYTTAMSFWYFAKHEVDIAVIETGLGGRLDSTNIINPEVCAITSISLDHINLLGDTLPAIAGEKAGIIKPNVPIVVGKNKSEVISVILSHALPLQAEVLLAEEMELPEGMELGLKGSYQVENAQTASAIAEVLQSQDWDIEERHVLNGLKRVIENTNFAGRWQKLGDKPKIICDVAHNEDGVGWIVKQLKEETYKHLHIVFGMVADKDLSNVLVQLPKDATYYFCAADSPRALPSAEMKAQAEKFGLNGKNFSSVSEAFKAAKESANQEDMIFIGGSVFVVAEIL